MATKHSTDNPDYTIPWVLDRSRTGDKGYEAANEAFEAHQELLKKAERTLFRALNHVTVLEGFLGDSQSDMAIHAESVVETIRQMLEDAGDDIDRQERMYRNLFIAYFDHKAGRPTSMPQVKGVRHDC